VSTGNEKITLSDKKRLKILNDGKKDHEKSGKRRKANRATDSLYMISEVDEEGDLVPVEKARNIADAQYNKSKNPNGIRRQYGTSTYFCGLQEGHKSEGHPEGHQTTKMNTRDAVVLTDDAILKEMKWQKDNNLEVVGFRDDGWIASGRSRTLVHHEDRERYIVILEKDEEGRSPQEQYDSLVYPVLDMTEMKKEKTGTKRKAEESAAKLEQEKQAAEMRRLQLKKAVKDGILVLSRSDGKTGYTGVKEVYKTDRDTGAVTTVYSATYKTTYLGQFESKEDAAMEYALASFNTAN